MVATKSATKKRKKILPQTLTEFKAWLSGVEEMQEDDWIPTSEQWALIRKRIDMVKDVEIITPRPAPTPRPVGPGPGNVIVPAMPQTASSFDTAEIVRSPAGAVAPVVNPQQPVDQSSVVTPDIDSSKGYNTSFV